VLTTAARRIRRFLPEVPILMFSMHGGLQVTIQAQHAEAQGLVSKSAAEQVLLEAMDAVFRGQTYFQP
jgi:two-component system, NarL family, invasion response regulator UvrY